MESHTPHLIARTQLAPGASVLVYYKSSKQNYPNEWVDSNVMSAEEHMVTCKRSERGAAMFVAYEYIRLMPTG